MLYSVFKYYVPVYSAFVVNNVKNSIVHPVKMALSHHAFYRITFHYLFFNALICHNNIIADFFLCSDCYFIKMKSTIPQNSKCLICHSSCDCLCCQIKYLISKIFPNSFYRREYRGNSLSNSCWCLYKQIFF